MVKCGKAPAHRRSINSSFWHLDTSCQGPGPTLQQHLSVSVPLPGGWGTGPQWGAHWAKVVITWALEIVVAKGPVAKGPHALSWW